MCRQFSFIFIALARLHRPLPGPSRYHYSETSERCREDPRFSTIRTTRSISSFRARHRRWPQPVDRPSSIDHRRSLTRPLVPFPNGFATSMSWRFRSTKDEVGATRAPGEMVAQSTCALHWAGAAEDGTFGDLQHVRFGRKATRESTERITFVDSRLAFFVPTTDLQGR